MVTHGNSLTFPLRLLVKAGNHVGCGPTLCTGTKVNSVFEGVILFQFLLPKSDPSPTFRRSVYTHAPADVNLWYYSLLPKEYQQNFLRFPPLGLCNVFLRP